jgi:hypothetical protein
LLLLICLFSCLYVIREEMNKKSNNKIAILRIQVDREMRIVVTLVLTVAR